MEPDGAEVTVDFMLMTVKGQIDRFAKKNKDPHAILEFAEQILSKHLPAMYNRDWLHGYVTGIAFGVRISRENVR